MFHVEHEKTKLFRVGIVPSEAVASKVIEVSRLMRQHGGMFSVEKDKNFPHITLYMAEFPESNKPFIEEALQRVAAETKPFLIRFREYEQSKNGFVLASYSMDDNLFSLHEKVVLRISPLREGIVRDDLIKRMPELTESQRKNVRLYGRTRVMHDYNPHITFTKVPESDPEIMKMLPELDFSFHVEEIGLYDSAEYGTSKHLYSRYALSGK